MFIYFYFSILGLNNLALGGYKARMESAPTILSETSRLLFSQQSSESAAGHLHFAKTNEIEILWHETIKVWF